MARTAAVKVAHETVDEAEMNAYFRTVSSELFAQNRALEARLNAAEIGEQRLEATLTKVLRAVAAVRGDVIDLEHARWAADGETDEGLQDVVAALQDVVADYEQYL